MNLLVIEDDRKLNRMLCEILEKEGYTVKACTDGEEGAYYLQQNAYDLALVDWMLPGESGPDILRESRRKGICKGAWLSGGRNGRKNRLKSGRLRQKCRVCTRHFDRQSPQAYSVSTSRRKA